MILSDLKTYLVERRCVPLADLVNRFGAQPSALRGMLETFIRKGRVRRVDPGAGSCPGCTKCDAYALEMYEWTG